MSYEKVVAFYDTAAHAEAAINMLKSAGYPADDISVFRNNEHARHPDFSETGFWRRLFGRNVTQTAAEARVQSAPAGSMIVSLWVPASEVTKVISMLANTADIPLIAVHTLGLATSKQSRVLVPPPTAAPTLRGAK